MKKLAIIIPTLFGGGAEKVAASMSKCLNDSYEIFIFVNQITEPTYEFSGELITINSKSAENYIGKLINIFTRTYKISQLKTKNSIDISISFMEGSNFVNILSKRKEKTIISVRTNISGQKNKSILNHFVKLFIKCLYNHADRITCVSHYIALDLSKNYNMKQEKLKTLYNPINIDEINALKEKPLEDDTLYLQKIYNENHTIIFVGRLVAAKALSNLIKSFFVLKQTQSNIKLIIIGDGEEKEKVLGLIKKLGVEDHVILLGFRRNPYLYISKSDLFALTSVREGMPNAILEAMACGVPILSTNCKTGPIEILNGTYDYDCEINGYWKAKYGVLTTSFRCNEYDKNIEDDHIHYAEAIRVLLMDKELKSQYKLASQQRVQDFDILQFKKKIIDLIEN